MAWEIMRILSSEEMEQWAVLSWSIWNACNDLIHNGADPNPFSIFEAGVGLLCEFKQGPGDVSYEG